MDLTLYKATALANIENFTDMETGEVDLEAWQQFNEVDLAEKQRAVAAYIRNDAVKLTGLKAMRDELVKPVDAEIDRRTKRQESLKKYLAENMKIAGISEVVASDGSFKATLAVDRDESVEWVEGKEVPRYLGTEKVVFTPSKTLAREAIERGEPVSCAVIVKKDRLTIK